MKNLTLLLLGREILRNNNSSKEFLGFSETIVRLQRFYNSQVRSYEVGNYGTLKLVNLSCDVIVEPLITANDPVTAQVFGDVEANIQQNMDGESDIVIEKTGKNEKIFIKVPVKYGLEAKLVDSASLTVSGLETDKVNLESEKGNITLKNLRAEKISAISHGGNISCHGVTQGSINLETTCKGSIEGKRFQGPKVVVKTDSGDISVQSTYSDSSFFETKYGSMNLKNLHRQAKVNVFGEGNVDINGLKIIVKKEASPGDIALSCNVTYGRIRIDRKDWFSTLGIEFNE
ncbi:uncharacterized protein LOC136033662 isoform X2 [Artemia franciscana]|uniref:uncharacterized protein LOC136033662 isoform X2 n=1 Tax=Artemia franciscana TaxID=6661 RepID=UPI0032DAAC98